MALTSAEKKKKQEELNRQGKLYLQAKAKGDKRAMAAAHATADKIRKEAGWSYDAKTGTTYEKVSPIQKKGTVVNSKENLSMAKAGANPVKAVQQVAKKSSILTNSPASKSSVQQAKKAADTAAKKKTAPSTNKVLELGRGPIKTDGLTKSSVQKAVDAKRASTLNQLLQKRAQAQGTLPKTSMLAKDQAGPFSAIPVVDALRNLTQGPLQMQKLNDALDDLRKSKNRRCGRLHWVLREALGRFMKQQRHRWVMKSHCCFKIPHGIYLRLGNCIRSNMATRPWIWTAGRRA